MKILKAFVFTSDPKYARLKEVYPDTKYVLLTDDGWVTITDKIERWGYCPIGDYDSGSLHVAKWWVKLPETEFDNIKIALL